MSLIVENGTGVSNANTYCDLQYVRAFCNLRDLNLPASDSVLEAAILIAMLYIESNFDKFDGHRSAKEQSLEYPRKSAIHKGYYLEANEIPVALKDALSYAAYLVTDDVEFQPVYDSSFVTEAQVSVLKAKFSKNFSKTNDGSSYFGAVDDLLKSLYKRTHLNKITKRHTF